MVDKTKRVVRCNRVGPTPFLESLDEKILGAVRAMRQDNPSRHIRIVDVGAGSGHNMHHVRKLLSGPKSCKGYDLEPADSYIDKIDLVFQSMPELPESVDIILCQYSLMFIPEYRLEEVLEMIHNMADDKALLIFEVFDAKQGHYPTLPELAKLVKKVNNFFFSRDWAPMPGASGEVFHKVFVKTIRKNTSERKPLPDSGSLRQESKKRKREKHES